MEMPLRDLTNLPMQLYEVTLDLRERAGELKETIKSKTKSFTRYGGPKDIGPMNRVANGLMGSGFVYTAKELYFYTPIHLPSAIIRPIMLSLLVYSGLEFLGAAVTGRFTPISTYISEKLSPQT